MIVVTIITIRTLQHLHVIVMAAMMRMLMTMVKVEEKDDGIHEHMSMPQRYGEAY